MKGFTDIHSHFVYGVDDGAKTRQDMEAMLDKAYADGISALFATPHIALGIEPFPHELFCRHLQEARAYCQRRGYDLKLFAGAELMYTPAMQRHIVQGRLPALNGGDHILMEFTPDISYQELAAALELLERSGYVAVIAHIERYACLFYGKNAWRLRETHEARYQVNASAVTGKHGFLRDRLIRKWFRDELIDFVASDAHNSEKRSFEMGAAYDALASQYGQHYACRLTGLPGTEPWALGAREKNRERKEHKCGTV